MPSQQTLGLGITNNHPIAWKFIHNHLEYMITVSFHTKNPCSILLWSLALLDLGSSLFFLFLFFIFLPLPFSSLYGLLPFFPNETNFGLLKPMLAKALFGPPKTHFWVKFHFFHLSPLVLPFLKFKICHILV